MGKRSSSDRRARSASVSSSSSSDSDVSSDYSRSRRRDDDDRKSSRHKKSHKKSDKKKKRDKSSSRSSSSRHHDKKKRKSKKARRSERDNDDDLRYDWKRAHAIVKELLREFPELRNELIGLLQMLHGGGVAVISGIENKRIRSQLKELFPLLQLTKLSEPRGAFAQRDTNAWDGDVTMLEAFLRELEQQKAPSSAPIATASDERERSSARVDNSSAASPIQTTAAEAEKPVEARREAPIGPAMPPGGFPPAHANATDNHDDDDDDDDDVVGPALPGMKGFRAADEHVEAEMARRALELKQAEWDRARGVSSNDAAADKSKSAPLVRQEWMTVMPESSFFKDSLAPANRPPGKAASFRTKEPAAVDLTWFDAPEERERARRAKLDIELLGYVREENAPSAASVAASRATPASDGASGVHESIVPAANPVADEKMRQQMERLRESRGPSLLEQHQQRLADEAKRTGGAKSKPKSGWDRDRDLTARRGMSNDDASKIIEASRGINAKFTAPTISRQFL